jgi:hypothetical protein
MLEHDERRFRTWRTARDGTGTIRISPVTWGGVALAMAAPSVIERDTDEPEADTVILPVVGDRVHYASGSGHLVGLQGVVVTDDHGPDLPSGLRYVLFDGEEWPKVVAVGALDRIGFSSRVEVAQHLRRLEVIPGR